MKKGERRKTGDTMYVRKMVLCGVSLGLMAACGPLVSQTSALPTDYTVTANNAMFGPATVTRTYRLGSKALVDNRSADDGGPIHMRTFYDLQKMESFTWDPVNSSSQCSRGTFSGDWGDPFTGAADLPKQGAKQVGTEMLHGWAAKVMELAAGPSGTMKVWVDSKSSMIVKAQVVPVSGPPKTMVEVTAVNMAPPPASVFVLPASCAAVAATPPPPTEADQIAALTGGSAQDFVRGIYGPGSKKPCAMVFRVVRAGTMEPIRSGFQVAVDLNVATEPTPSYIIGMSQDGHATFSGGGLHEVTAQMHDGVLRIDNVPAQFEMDLQFGSGGSASANVYRQCFAPQTALVYVVKNPGNIQEGGDWLWVKSGRYAVLPQ